MDVSLNDGKFNLDIYNWKKNLKSDHKHKSYGEKYKNSLKPAKISPTAMDVLKLFMLLSDGKVVKKISLLSVIGAEKIMFPPLCNECYLLNIILI